MSGLTSGAPEPGIRTYNPQVRVGNWNEDICLEEDLLNGTLYYHRYITMLPLLFRFPRTKSKWNVTNPKEGQTTGHLLVSG